MNMLKLYFQILDRVSPKMAAKKMYHVMSNPRKLKPKAQEEEVLARSEMKRVKYKQFDVQQYSWGQSNHPVAFLVHGWEGNAGNFGALIDLLLEKSYRVIAFDAPSHGKSSYSNTNMFEYSDFITRMMREHSPKLVISHSFGSVTSAFALKENPHIYVDHWYMITTPYAFRSRINQMSRWLGIGDRTKARLIQLLEDDMKIKVDELNMKDYGGSLENLKKATIVHSKKDRIIPIESARHANKAIPQSELIELEDPGHYSILWSDELKEIIKTTLN